MSKVSGSSGGSKPPSSTPASKPSTTSKPASSSASSSGGSAGASAAASSTTKATTASSASTGASTSSASDTTKSGSTSNGKSTSSTASESKESGSGSEEKSSSALRPKDAFEKSGEFRAEKDDEKNEKKSDTEKLISSIRESYRTDSKEMTRELEQVEQKLEVGNIDKGEGAKAVSRLESDVSDMSGEKKEHFQSRVEKLKNDLLGGEPRKTESDPNALRKLEDSRDKAAAKDPSQGVESQDREAAESARDDRAQGSVDPAQASVEQLLTHQDAETTGRIDRARETAAEKREDTKSVVARELRDVVSREQAQRLAENGLENLRHANPAAGDAFAGRASAPSILTGPASEQGGLKGLIDRDPFGRAQAKGEQSPARFDPKKAESLKALERSIINDSDREKQRLTGQVVELKSQHDLKAQTPYKTSANLTSLNRGIAEAYGPLRDESLEQARSSKLGDKVYDPRTKAVRELGQFDPAAENNEKGKLESAAAEVKIEGEKTEAAKDIKIAEADKSETAKDEKKAEGEKTAETPGDVEKSGDDKLAEEEGKSETTEGESKSSLFGTIASAIVNPIGTAAAVIANPEPIMSSLFGERRELSENAKADTRQRIETSETALRAKVEDLGAGQNNATSAKVTAAYEAAISDRDKTLSALEKEYGRYYTPEEAKAKAEKALESKEDFYVGYLSLQESARGRSKADLERLNEPGAQLAIERLKEGQPPATAALTGQERVELQTGAIQDTFKDLASTEEGRAALKQRLTEQFANDNVDPKKIDELVQQAQDGRFPIPQDIQVVPSNDPRLGEHANTYDPETKQFIVSENVAADPARLQKALFAGSLQHVNNELGAQTEGKDLWSWLGFSKKESDNRLFADVHNQVERRSNEAAAAAFTGHKALEAPDQMARAQQTFSDEMKRQNASLSPKEITDLTTAGLKDAKSYETMFGQLYAKGDEATKARLQELNPNLAAALDQQSDTNQGKQLLQLDQSVYSNKYETYRDQNDPRNNLDALHHIDQGYQFAKQDDGRATTSALRREYEAQGFSRYEARQMADSALGSEKNLYSQFSSLYRNADEEGKKRLREANPHLAELAQKESDKTLRTNEQWRADVKSSEGSDLVGSLLGRDKETIARIEGKLTAANTTEENRSFRNVSQEAIKARATKDETAFRGTLTEAFPDASKESIDRLVELAKTGEFPMAENVRFIDSSDPRLNSQNASFDSANNTVYLDKELMKSPDKAVSAYLEENGHHLDAVLGGKDSRGDEGEIFKDGVLGSNRSQSKRDRRRKQSEDDSSFVIMPDGTLRVVENQHRVPDHDGKRGTNPVGKTGEIAPGRDFHRIPGPDKFSGERPPGRDTSGPGNVIPNSDRRDIGSDFGIARVDPNSDTNFDRKRNLDDIPGFGRHTERTSDTVGPSRVEPDRNTDTGGNRNFDRPPVDRTEKTNFQREAEPPTPRPNLQQPSYQEVKNQLEQELQKKAQQNEIRDPEDVRKLEETAAKLKDLPQALGELEKLKDAFKDMGGLSKSLDDLKNLSRSLNSMKDLGGNLETLHKLGNMQSLVKELPDKLANLERLPQALETLGDFKKTFGDLNQLPKMLEQMRELPKQMAQLENLPKVLAAFNRAPENLPGLEKLPSFLQSAVDFAPKRGEGAKLEAGSSNSSVLTTPAANKAQKTGVPRPITPAPAKFFADRPSPSPYAGKFGTDVARLGPNIGPDASRHNQARKGAITPAFGASSLPAPSGAGLKAPSLKPPPSTRPLDASRLGELRQLPQKLQAAAKESTSLQSLKKLQGEFGNSTAGLEKLPGALKASESMPRSISELNRVNAALTKKDALAQGLSGLKSLADLATANPKQVQGLQDLATMLTSANERPDTLKGMARMPGLVGYMSGVKGDSPEAMANVLKTIQAKPAALEGLKAFNTLMAGFRENPQLAQSLDQLTKMVRSGELDKLSQSTQKLSAALASPQSVFGLDKLETLGRRYGSGPNPLNGLERFGQLFAGRERAGTEGVNRLGHLLQMAQSKPEVMQSMVNRALERQVTGSNPGQSLPPSRAAEGGLNPEAAVRGGKPFDIANKSKAAFGSAALERLGTIGSPSVKSNVLAPSGNLSSAISDKIGATPTPTRTREYRQAFNILDELGSQKVNREDHTQKLREMSAGFHGAQAVADAFEAKVVAKPENLRSIFENVSSRPETARAFAQTLVHLAEHTPDRLVGTLLLATDQPQGKQTVADLFSGLASDSKSAASLAKVIGAATRTDLGAAGMKELLTGLYQSDDDPDGARANQTTRALVSASQSPTGARGLAEGLKNLTALDGGSREIGSFLRSMNSSSEGSRAASALLLNLAHDREGARDLGRVLARAGKSQAGGRDLLASFQSMAKSEAGKSDLSRLMMRLTESEQGTKLLANLTRDRDNAARMTKLLQTFQDSPESGARMRQAIERAVHHPQAKLEAESLRGRMGVDAGLREAMENLATPSKSQPFTISQSVRGADAMARLTAFENLARTASASLNQETPISTVKAAEGGAAGNSAGSGSGSGSGGGGERAPFPSPSHPYPDLATVSDVWKQGVAGKAAAAESLAELAQASASERGETGAQDTRERLSAFRPGDVYSDMTLLRARICGDCGFRTNSIGQCGRCGFSLLEETTQTKP